MILARRLRPRRPKRLGRRIAAAMLIALMAVQTLNAAVFYLKPPPTITVYSAIWLLERAEQAVAAIFAADEAGREPLAQSLDAEQELHISWLPRLDLAPPPEGRRLFLARLQASLERRLAGKVLEVRTSMHRGPPGTFPDGEARSVPPDFASRLSSGPIVPGDVDVPIIGRFLIAVQGLDGSWILIEPGRQSRFMPPLDAWILIAAAVAAIVSALSIRTARLWLRPLDQLAEAAEKLGRTREPTPVDTEGLQDFQVIADALNGMQTRVKRFIDERTQMLAAISHDLRTPLTRMRLAAEELPGCEVRERIIAQTEEMESMLAATLTFAAGALNGERRETVDLAALLISVCDDFSDRGAPATYSGPDHAFLVCQPIGMKRALVNLIGNAVKYGVEAQVELQAGAGEMVVTVADRGPGVPPDQVELAFQPFRRLEGSRSRETGGAGLGLTIARDIVQAHGGDIRLVNRVGGGLEAVVRLDAARIG
jgi:signal transduction histidine kinase